MAGWTEIAANTARQKRHSTLHHGTLHHCIASNSVAERNAVLEIKDLFNQARVDDIISHDDIRKAINKHIDRSSVYQYYYCVSRAKDLLNKETGAVFATVKSFGYRRLNASNGVIYAGERPLNRVRRLTRRARNHLFNAIQHSNDLSASDRRQAFQRASTLALIEHLTLAKTVRTMPDDDNSIIDREDPLKVLRDSLGV